jgi:hypothetical protein
MITYKFTCESCARVVEQYQRDEPSFWRWTYVKLNYWEGYRFLLCGNCSDEIRNYSFLKATLVKLGIIKPPTTVEEKGEKEEGI